MSDWKRLSYDDGGSNHRDSDMIDIPVGGRSSLSSKICNFISLNAARSGYYLHCMHGSFIQALAIQPTGY